MNDRDGAADYRTRLQKGLIDALLNAGATSQIDGKRAITILSAEATDELLNVIALLMHSSPECRSPTQLRAACDNLARRLQRIVSAFQKAPPDFIRTMTIGDLQ